MLAPGERINVRSETVKLPEIKEKSVTVGGGNKSYGSILNGLKGIKEEYDASLRERARAYARESGEAETFETDEALTARATGETSASYDPKRAKAAARRDEKVEDAERERAGLSAGYLSALRAVKEREERALSAHAEKMSSHGLSHSSAAALKEEAIRAEGTRDYAAAGSLYGEKLSAVESKIRRAERAYDEAMKEYEISYAIDLEKKIARYKSQRDKLLAAYASSAEKAEADRLEAYLKEDAELNAAYEDVNGDYTGEKKTNYDRRYDYVIAEIADFTDEKKKDFLEENREELRAYLGLYYDKLARTIGG
ncbi:MAG: hypothetical protein J6Y74_04075 [Clostridia bacterium]|nr:hypothetical protein [Clostridia bacterium]